MGENDNMTLFRTVLLTSGLVLAFCGGAAQAQQNVQDASASKPMMTLQMPALPDSVRVTLNPATTALLVLDYVEPICNCQPKCKCGMLSAVIPFMALAHKAGLGVGYGSRWQTMSNSLPQLAPAPVAIK